MWHFFTNFMGAELGLHRKKTRLKGLSVLKAAHEIDSISYILKKSVIHYPRHYKCCQVYTLFKTFNRDSKNDFCFNCYKAAKSQSLRYKKQLKAWPKGKDTINVAEKWSNSKVLDLKLWPLAVLQLLKPWKSIVSLLEVPKKDQLDWDSTFKVSYLYLKYPHFV